MKKKAALAFAIGCVLALFIVEGVLRFIPPFDRFVTYSDALVSMRRPNVSFIFKGLDVGRIGDYRVERRTNSLGFQDHEYSVEKGVDVVRVLILGDSQVEALQVPLELSYHKQLEARLRTGDQQVEVIALGRSGYGAADALEAYRDVGRAYDPDYVVWGFTDQNDVHDAYPRLNGLIIRGDTRRRTLPPPLLHRSILASLIFSRNWRRDREPRLSDEEREELLPGRYAELMGRGSLRDPTYLEDPPPLYDEALRFFERDLGALIDEIRSDGLPMLVLSTAGQAYKNYLEYRHPDFVWQPRKLDDLAEHISQTRGVRFVSMKPLFGAFQASTDEPVVFRRDGHLNERGHSIVADVLHTELTQFLVDPTS